MRNKISRLNLLNIGFIFLSVGVIISFVEIFLPLLSYSFNSKAFTLDLIGSVIAFLILMLINSFSAILSYINKDKCSKKIIGHNSDFMCLEFVLLYFRYLHKFK